MGMHQKIKIYNGKIITASGIIPNGAVLISDGLIEQIGETEIESTDAIEINANGKYISPGFIDIHLHGGGGSDFMDATDEAFKIIAETHVRYGTTSMFPTTLTGDHQDLIEFVHFYEQLDLSKINGAQLLGIHLEGPYFALNQRGAQDAKYIRNPDPLEYLPMVAGATHIKRWSAAPELPGAIEFGKCMKQRGILPAMAHTDAVYEQVLDGFNNGFSLATHLYSGMSGITRTNGYRNVGAIESSLVIDGMDVELIADGSHLPAPLLQLVYKIKGPDKIALVTDAMRGAAMPEGESILGNKTTGMKVIIEDGVAKLPDRTAFAGSVATADRLVRNMIQLAGASLQDAVKMMSATPARIMGIEQRKGSIKSEWMQISFYLMIRSI